MEHLQSVLELPVAVELITYFTEILKTRLHNCLKRKRLRNHYVNSLNAWLMNGSVLVSD